jgi:hypothetical protein
MLIEFERNYFDVMDKVKSKIQDNKYKDQYYRN